MAKTNIGKRHAVRRFENKPVPKRDEKTLLELLKREFPLMSSRRLPFMTAEMVIRVYNGEFPECEGLHKSVTDYVKWMKSNYDPELDPANKYD